MRYPLALTAFLILGCAGPGVARLDRAGFALDVMDGSVSDDRDLGNDGEYVVEWGLSSQAVSWSAISEEDTLEEDVELLWTAMEALFAADGTLEKLDRPDFVAGTVAGQPSLGFEADLSGATLVSTTWRCPESGVQVTVNSSGLGGASATHQASLDSAACKTTRVERVAGPTGYRFVGDRARWRVTAEDPSDQSMEWTRADDVVIISAFPQVSLLVEDDLCEATMGLILGIIEADLDPSKSRFSQSATECRQDFAGAWADGSGPLRGRVLHEACGGDGYAALCLISGDGAIDEACKGVVACDPG